jgi:hypothetical protein
MLSCRTKDEKLLCLKNRGRTYLAKSSCRETRNEVPEGLQWMRPSDAGSFTMEKSLLRKAGIVVFPPVAPVAVADGDGAKVPRPPLATRAICCCLCCCCCCMCSLCCCSMFRLFSTSLRCNFFEGNSLQSDSRFLPRNSQIQREKCKIT